MKSVQWLFPSNACIGMINIEYIFRDVLAKNIEYIFRDVLAFA